MSKNSKGSVFEREICKQLSLWWSDDIRDDIFWRTHGSGSRATTREKTGQTTAGQYGDIAASDPAGLPLIRCLTFSLKRGYSQATIHDLIDKPPDTKTQIWENWINEIRRTARQARTPYWAIIAKRDRREPVILLPHRFVAERPLNCSAKILPGVVLRLHSFLTQVNPDIIRKMVE